jgi:hypothetical protein
VNLPRQVPIPVALEAGARRVFAFALDWPGWCRSGRDEARALEALVTAADRYAGVAAAAGARLPGVGAGFEVVERLAGSTTTDFGAPAAIAGADRRPLTAAGARRLASLVAAAHAEFDAAAAAAPAILRKGPRGGGRDRDAIVAHVIEAEAAYARRLGIGPARVAPSDPGAAGDSRRAIDEALRVARAGTPLVEGGWLVRFAARRIAWHALDHAWEIADRSG